jgi:integrase
MATNSLSTTPKRDTAWKRDGRVKGVYWRRRADGSKSWGFYAEGKIHSALSRQAAIDEKARAGLRKSAGLPAPDTRVLIRDLAEDVRELKRRKLRPSSFAVFEYALDTVILPAVGHLKPAQVGPDRVARLIRDLEERGLAPASIRRYLVPLTAIFKLAIRRGIVHTSPIQLLSDDERPRGGGLREHYVWSPTEISALITAAHDLGRRPDARYDYAPLIETLAITGLRVSEALALRVEDVDLVDQVLHVRHSIARTGGDLCEPKTAAGKRAIPLAPGLVDLFVRIIPSEAQPDDFVFHARGNPRRPLSYFNFRMRGFRPALELARLDRKGITIHSLRSAAASLYAAHGITDVELATVLGHADANITRRVYAKLFDPKAVHEKIRTAQTSISLSPSRPHSEEKTRLSEGGLR